MIKKFCDRCKREIPYSDRKKASANIMVKDEGSTRILTSYGKEICVIAGRYDLCFDCYDELVNFLENKEQGEKDE